jgi:isopentenyl-diphosphate delta-isomerase
LVKSLTEHEFDHVFIGKSDKQPNINPDEVASWKYVDLDWLESDVKENPEDYTVWFKIVLAEVISHFNKLK